MQIPVYNGDSPAGLERGFQAAGFRLNADTWMLEFNADGTTHSIPTIGEPFTGGLYGDGFQASAAKSTLSFDAQWFHVNRTQDVPDQSLGLSFEEQGVVCFAFGFDYQMSEGCLWGAALGGDLWRFDPATGKMIFGAVVGTPSVENCHFVFKGDEAGDYVMGWRHGLHDIAWMDKNGVLTIPYLKATTGTRYLVIDDAGTITSSASAPSGS